MAKKVTDKKVVAKKAAPKKETVTATPKAAVKLEPTKMYDFLVTKDTKHLKKGTYTITGEMCSIFIKIGIGSVKS